MRGEEREGDMGMVLVTGITWGMLVRSTWEVDNTLKMGEVKMDYGLDGGVREYKRSCGVVRDKLRNLKCCKERLREIKVV